MKNELVHSVLKDHPNQERWQKNVQSEGEQQKKTRLKNCTIIPY